MMEEKSLIEAVGPSLENFKHCGKGKYNFRCVYCGDSKKDPSKSRAWFLPPDRHHRVDSYVYYCFNCNKSTTLDKFLREHFPTQYDELLLDKYRRGGRDARGPSSEVASRPSETDEFDDRLSQDLVRLSLLPRDHPCVEFCESRLIPEECFSDLWYAERFEPWVESILPEHNKYKKVSPRLVLPFRTRSGSLFGVQGRAIDGDGIRYKTFLFAEGRPQVFGMNRVNFNRRFYVLEGAIDSLFVSNSIAVNSSNLVSGLRSLRTIEKNAVLLFDNQPRNLEITNCLREAVCEGYAVCVWPRGLRAKDPNDMILSGLSRDELMKIIRDNTFQGLGAETVLIERKFIRGKRFDRGTEC